MRLFVWVSMPLMYAADGSGGQTMEVDPATLTTIAGLLDDGGAPLLARASAMQTVPDAGASTELVADTMMALATVIAGLSGHIGDLAAGTGAASGGYTQTDVGSAGGLRAIAQ